MQDINLPEISHSFLRVRSGKQLSKSVYLVYPDFDSWHGLPYHAGIASLGATLQAHGYTVKVKYICDRKEYPVIMQEVLDLQPAVVGFTTVETQYGYVQEMAAMIKEQYPCITVVGGSHITLYPEALLEDHSESLDCGMRGECEGPFLDLCEKVRQGEEFRDIENVCFIHPQKGGLVQNSLRPLEQDLGKLPFPATELFDYQEIINENQMALFHFNRGCPYPCTYCSAQKLAKEYGTVKEGLRQMPARKAIDTIKFTLQKYDVPSDTLLLFSDDLFTMYKDWLYEFLDLYEVEIGRPFWSTARSNTASDEQFDRLKSAGCRTIMMAIESGNDFIRNKVMKRNISRKVMFNSFELADRYKIRTCSPCVIGVPFETSEMIEDSIDTVSQLNVTEKGVNIFFPYRGTPLRTVCEENNFLPDFTKVKAIERKESVLNLPTIKQKEIQYYHDNWERLILQRMGGRHNIGSKCKDIYLKLTDNPLGKKAKHFVDHNKSARKFKEATKEILGISNIS
jgi:anaerobic magnesium-protoporphyrin IX monomethyl ester cyclase